MLNSQVVIQDLQPDASYEFRVSTIGPDGSQSEPSDISDIVRLRPLHRAGTQHQRPERPTPPEYLEFDGGTNITLCWLPAKSTLPILVLLT